MNRSLTAAVLGMAALASLPLRADSPYAEGKQCTLSTLRGIYLLTARLDAPRTRKYQGFRRSLAACAPSMGPVIYPDRRR